MVKNLPASAGDARDVGSVSGLGGSPGVGNDTYSSILAWKSPWAWEPGGLQSRGPQRAGHDWAHTQSVFHLQKLSVSVIFLYTLI